jgi:hypothetical protein
MTDRIQVGLVVAFADLGETEHEAVETTWDSAEASAEHWRPTGFAYGLEPIGDEMVESDILVYLGESSRFLNVVRPALKSTPTLLVKSTVDELLARAPEDAPRYRMCTSVKGIASTLASLAPRVPSVAWDALPWPDSVRHYLDLDSGERSFVETSVAAFREAAERRGIPWRTSKPEEGDRFSIFLTMHDPAAARLADTALTRWPECTVLAADGMVSTTRPNGEPWPERVARVRHWSPNIASVSNRAFSEALGGDLPDFDSAGMLFGALFFLDRCLAAGAAPAGLERAGERPGPLGLMELTASGRPEPERIVVFRGETARVVVV